jgi:sulfatase modifying factor 1
MLDSYRWHDSGVDHELRLVRVPGTDGMPFLFHGKPIEIASFWIATHQVTQALWQHVTGANPAKHVSPSCPVENVSWQQITAPDGFLDQLNRRVLPTIANGDASARFRLPSEAEWEYAARGGPSWRDGFRWSGSNNPDDVAWYGPRWTAAHELFARIAGWRFAWKTTGRIMRMMPRRPTFTHEVGLKQPNQLGTFDMSGNVWEWCQDVCTEDVANVPADGTAYEGVGDERRLRGGCFNNWDMHCQVFWRYGIVPDAHDSCLGLRLVLG